MDGEGAPTTTVTTPQQTPPQTTETTPTTTPTTTASWTSMLSDEALRNDPTVMRYKTPDEAAKGLIEANKMLGQRPQGITPLTPESTPEQVAAYRKAMGIPETPDGYQVATPTYPEGVTRSDEQMAAFRALAHEIHLTPSQLEKIFAFDAQRVASDLDAANGAMLEEMASSLSKLQARFGPLAEQKLLQAREYVRRRFGEDGVEELESLKIKDPATGLVMSLANSPTFIEILTENAHLTGHDKFIIGDGRGGQVTKESALQQIMQLHQQRREGRINERDFKEQFDRLAPIAYSEPGDKR
jgi:hypothetical protein